MLKEEEFHDNLAGCIGRFWPWRFGGFGLLAGRLNTLEW
jgi:hypothetical protein